MTGLLLIVLVIGWIAIVAAIAGAVARRTKAGARRAAVGTFAFVLLLLLPVVDEIIGGFQLRALCREGAVPTFDEKKLSGKTVRTRLVPHPDVPNVMQTPTRRVRAIIPIEEQAEEWIDAATAEVLLSSKSYTAKGGLLIRALGISNNDSPLTIDPTWCGVNVGPIFERLGVKAN